MDSITTPAPVSHPEPTELSPLFTEAEEPTPPPPFAEITAPEVEPRSVRDETSPATDPETGLPKYRPVLSFDPPCTRCINFDKICVRGVGETYEKCDPCQTSRRRCLNKGPPAPGGWSIDPVGDLYQDVEEHPSSSLQPNEYPPISPASHAKLDIWESSK